MFGWFKKKKPKPEKSEDTKFEKIQITKKTAEVKKGK